MERKNVALLRVSEHQIQSTEFAFDKSTTLGNITLLWGRLNKTLHVTVLSAK